MTSSQRNPGRPAPAIIVGMDCVTGLQSARILTRRGVPVIGIAKDPHHFCCRTRACERILSCDTAGEELIETLETLAASLDTKAVLFPCTDLSVLVLSRHRDRLASGFRLALPPPEAVETLTDKITFHTFAMENDLPVPGTFFLSNREDAERAATKLTYPCVLKPPLKTPAWERHVKAKVFQVDDATELLALYDRCSPWIDLLMVQEKIEGPETDQYTINCYHDADSEPLVTFVTRKIRQWPPETGIGCAGIECRNDEVVDIALRLFRSAAYRGLGYVEMKRDVRDGRFYIIEPNIGRPTGRSATAEAAGVELLYTMYCDAAGLPLPENREQRDGQMKWIHIRHDVQALLWHWRRGNLTIGEWWRSWRGPKTWAVFSWSDPVPFWFDLWRSAGKVFGRDGNATKAGDRPDAETGAEAVRDPSLRAKGSSAVG